MKAICWPRNLPLNLLLFLYLFFKSSFDSFNVRLNNLKVSLVSSIKSPQYSTCASSSSIKHNRKSHSLKNRCLRWLFLILVFNCCSGQLEANSSRSSNLFSLNSYSSESFLKRLLLNLSIRSPNSSPNAFYPFSKESASIFNQFSSYLMSFLSINNQHFNSHNNQVINQLSDQASSGSELELSERVDSSSISSNGSVRNRASNATGDLDGNKAKITLENAEQIERNVDSKDINSSKNVSNSIINGNGETIKGHPNSPLHKLMLKDEFKLFFNHNKEITSQTNVFTHLTDRLPSNKAMQGTRNVPNTQIDELSSQTDSLKSDDSNAPHLSQTETRQDAARDEIPLHEDYELLDMNKIKFFANPTLETLNSSQQTSKLNLSFNIFNRTFELDLVLNNKLFAPNFTVQKSDSRLLKNFKLKNFKNCFYHGTLRTNPSTKLPGQLSGDISADRTKLNSSGGHSDSQSVVSLSNCDGLRGLLQTDDYLYIINPLNEQLIDRYNLKNQIQLSKSTLFVKRTKNKDLINNLAKQITNQVNNKTKKANGHRTDSKRILNERLARLGEVANEQQSTSQATRRTKRSTFGKIRSDYQNPTIELAVFGDESLYNYLKNTYFIKTDHQIVTFILTILNGIQSLYNQFHKYDINLRFNIVLLEIFQKQPKDLVPTDLQEKYLFRFCDWQAKRKYENTRSRFGSWDHAFLLTALDLARYDKETNVKIDSVIGSALVGKMCTESSCSIGEGTLLGTILVMAHEIAHSMDLSHDGDMEHSGTNNCQNERYIMTSSLGPGVYSFSPCSARELKDYLRKPNAKCLFVNNSKLRLKRKFLNEFHITNKDDVLGSWEKGSNLLAGQAYSMDNQCRLVFGENAFYAPTKYYTLCEAVTCRMNMTYEGIRYAHPTLEGTICGYEKWCRKGECVQSNLKETDSKDTLNNEINTLNPYSIDLTYWKEDERQKSNKTAIRANKTKPKWKIFENNYDTSVNKRLLNSRLKNHTSLSSDRTDDLTDMKIDNKTFNDTHKTKIDQKNNSRIDSIVKTDSTSDRRNETTSQSNLTNLTSYWISLFDKRKKEKLSNQLSQGWSSWSNWSDCVSECVIADQDKQPVGFEVSTRKCYTKDCPGSRIRIKLCDARLICSAKLHIKTLNQYVNTVCDTSPIFNQTNQAKVDGCFIKNCPNNELVSNHVLQLPNTSPCFTNISREATNGYCFNGKCRSFGQSDATETKACKHATAGLTVKENSINDWHPLSNCKQSCIRKSSGIQLVYQDCDRNECTSLERQSFQLCSAAEEDCLERELKSVNEYANEICSKYKLKYPSLLSGIGKQLSPRKGNMHSSCVVSCADLKLPNVYYEMNSILDAKFPTGTNCTFNSSVQSYCVNAKCIQFGNDLTPLDKIGVSNSIEQLQREMVYRNRHR